MSEKKWEELKRTDIEGWHVSYPLMIRDESLRDMGYVIGGLSDYWTDTENFSDCVFGDEDIADFLRNVESGKIWDILDLDEYTTLAVSRATDEEQDKDDDWIFDKYGIGTGYVEVIDDDGETVVKSPGRVLAHTERYEEEWGNTRG